MEKSTAYMATTAALTVRCWAASLSATKKLTMSPVNPRSSKNRADMIAPIIMKGLRLPHLDVDLSASVPTIGWTMSPERGPAIHTREVLLLVRPRERRYGVQ